MKMTKLLAETKAHKCG